MLSVRIISINSKDKNEPQKNKAGVTREEFDYRMEMLEVKTEQLDRKLSKKADDIVSYQLLQHRQELEELYQAIKNIDSQLKHIELELDKFTPQETTEMTREDKQYQKPKNNVRLLHT